MAEVFEFLFSWAFCGAWPRIRARPETEVSLAILPRAPDLEQARRALWDAPRFEPPFQVALVPYGEGLEEGALVQLQVTHMLSDGFCWVPLFADIASFVAQLEASPEDVAVEPLPPVSSSFAALEPRLLRTIAGDTAMNDVITHQCIGKTWEREAHTVILAMPEALVSAVREAARRLAVSDDVLMLSALATALARFQDQRIVSLAMVAPQRDGLGTGDMVGLFADIRHFCVGTEGLSYAGVALHVAHVVKERLWRPPPVATQFSAAFINFEWTDFDERHGFSQQVYLRQGPEHLANPMKFAVDQPSSGTWRIRAAFDIERYTSVDRERMLGSLRRSLAALLEEPLAFVWGSSNADVEFSNHMKP